MITVEDVLFQYGANTPTPVTALNHVSLKVREGEFLCIVGHNGSGKSTMAKSLNALLTPTAGDIWVDELNTKEKGSIKQVRQRVGMVFQNPDNQLVSSTVERDIAFGMENLGLPREEMQRRLEEALNIVGMTEFRRSPPHLLSGGQKQRVAVAGVFAMRPKYMILDEATSMLDPSGREDVMKTVFRLNRQEGLTVIHITHLMHEVVNADRVIVMEKGEIVMEGTPREIFRDSERLLKLDLDVPPVTDLAQRLAAQGYKVPPDVLTIPELVGALQGGVTQ